MMNNSNLFYANDAWDNLDQQSKLQMLRKALGNGVVDVEVVKRMYNNKVLEDYDLAVIQLQLYDAPELSTQLLQQVYNMVEGNPQLYRCGGHINRYDDGTSDFFRLNAEQILGQTLSEIKFPDVSLPMNTSELEDLEILKILIPLYVMPVPYQQQLNQEIDYDELQNWIMENFGGRYGNGLNEEYMLLPLRHRQVIKLKVDPNIQESSIFKNLAMQEDFSDANVDRNLYRKGGNKNNNGYMDFANWITSITEGTKKNLDWRKKAEIDMMYDAFNKGEKPIYESNKYKRRLLIKEKLNKEYKKKNIFDKINETAKFIKTYSEEKEDKLKELQPYLDKMFPDKEIQKDVLNYFDTKESNLSTKLLNNNQGTLPPYSMITRLVNLYKLAGEPVIYNPRSFGKLAIPLYHYYDVELNPEKNIYRAFHLPTSDVMGSLSIFANSPDFIRLDPNYGKRDGASKLVSSLMTELSHSIINHNKDKTFEYGINGYNFLKSLFNYDDAYYTKGNFEYITHGGGSSAKKKDKYNGFQPYLEDYLYMKDIENGDNNDIRNAAYSSFNLDKIVKDPRVVSNKEYIKYMPNGLGFGYDIASGILLDALFEAMPKVYDYHPVIYGASRLYDKAVEGTNLPTSNDIKQTVGDAALEGYRFITNPRYTWRNHIAPALNNVGEALGLSNVFSKGGNKKKGTSWLYSGKKDLTIPVEMSPYEALRLIGVPFNPNTKSGYIRPLNAPYGVKNSWHKKPWRGSKKYGSAVDLTPAPGYTYDDMLRAMAHPALLEWVKANGFGILDERPASVRVKTRGTGPHLHFGPSKNNSYLSMVSPHFSYWDNLGMKVNKKGYIVKLDDLAAQEELIKQEQKQIDKKLKYLPVIMPIMLPYNLEWLIGAQNNALYNSSKYNLLPLDYNYIMPYLLNYMSYMNYMPQFEYQYNT